MRTEHAETRRVQAHPACMCACRERRVRVCLSHARVLPATRRANVILGLEPGEVFVQRNVGNQATHVDLNTMSCLEYAVKELKVRRVMMI